MAKVRPNRRKLGFQGVCNKTSTSESHLRKPPQKATSCVGFVCTDTSNSFCGKGICRQHSTLGSCSVPRFNSEWRELGDSIQQTPPLLEEVTWKLQLECSLRVIAPRRP